MRFIRSQLRPQADWIGSEWVKIKNKVFQHMFRTGKLVEMTREKEKIWIRALVITEIRSQGDDRRKFLIKRCTISQNSSDLAEGKHLIVDICKIRPSPPRDLCAEYSLNDYVEVVVTHGWRKGRVTEILLENKYKVYFAATKEDAIFNYTEIRLSMEWLGGGSWIKAHEVNDVATEIKSSRESHRNTSFLEATETETQNHEPVDGVKLPLPQESDDMMDDVATPIIDPQEIPQDEEEVETSATKKKKKDSWMNKNQTLNTLLKLLVEKSTELTADQRLRLGATILVDVKCILGDPELHSDLVEDVDCEFGRVVDLVKRGYLLLNIRGETVKETEKSKETEAATKTNGKKNGVRPPREVDHLEEDDTEKKRNKKSMWTTVIKRVKIQKPMKDTHKRKRNNNKRMTQKSMQMWASVLKKVKIQKPMK
ncbi:unnamed protein product [Brassica napus]|uniref:(rape) hypothetical protein n=1 Tax=Brassica napus TaxID=3708 RepID=A0A816KHY2_BRANA|nr:unnamed protein product [Brassica napus]